MPRKAGYFLAAFLIAFFPLALAQGTYTQIDVPGAGTTACLGINQAGDIVGVYYNVAIPHGFLLSGGVFTTIDYPGASSAVAQGINDIGQIVGQYTGAIDGGFIYDEQTQTYTTIYHPGSTQTYATAINNAGTTVGVIVNQVRFVAFELNGKTYRRILPRGFVSSGVGGINNLGVVVVIACPSVESCTPFLFKQGQFQRLRIPAHDAAPIGLNDTNAIVGYYLDAMQNAVGFLYQNNTLQSLTFPGSMWTVAAGVNNVGEVSGYFGDASGIEHGFTWTPPGDLVKK
jgi:uncharacterized membrane protein